MSTYVQESFTNSYGKNDKVLQGIRSSSGGVIQIPRSNVKGNKGTLTPDFTKFTWLKMDVYSIDKQNALPKGSAVLEGTSCEVTFKFLLPMKVMEAIQHQWGEYNSILSGAGRFYTEFMKNANEIGSIASNTLAYGKNGINAIQNGIKSKNIGNLLSSGTDFLASTANVYNMRMDSALTYQNSARRRYNMEFEFADLGDPKNDILFPIKSLEYLSSAGLKQGFGEIVRPYVFKIYSYPVNWLNVRWAALESALPTYEGPYRNGYPTKASLQLTFVDISPLFREAISLELYGDNSNEIITDTSTSSSSTSSTNSYTNNTNYYDTTNTDSLKASQASDISTIYSSTLTTSVSGISISQETSLNLQQISSETLAQSYSSYDDTSGTKTTTIINDESSYIKTTDSGYINSDYINVT